MLKHWDTHAEYQHFISEAMDSLNPSQLKKFSSMSDSLDKLTSMNLDPVGHFLAPYYRYIRLTYLMNDLLNAVDRDVIGLQVGVELSYLTVPEQEMVEEVHESTGKYPSLEQAKKIRQHREEKTLTKEIVRLLVIGERKKKTTVTLKQDEIKKYFPPEYDEQKIRTVICQLLEEWSNQNH